VTKDYYQILGIQRTASSDDVSKAFRQMAQKYHPDRNPGNKNAESMFKEANEAYQTLSDTAKRAQYDIRTNPINPFQTGNPFGFGGPFGNPVDQHIQDIFDTLMGGIPRPTRRRNPNATGFGNIIPGENVEVEIYVSIEESIQGCKKPIHVKSQKLVQCNGCKGTGGAPGTTSTICSKCAGHGKGVEGHFKIEVKTCQVCRGSGRVPINKCRVCKGAGSNKFERETTVVIPPGISDGMKLRLAGMGIPGSPPGDLFVIIRIIQENQNGWKRVGEDIVISHQINLRHAILGGSTPIKLPGGREMNIEIPPGTQPGDKITIQGEGVKAVIGSAKGDVQVIISVLLPKVLSHRARKLLDELAEETSR
jgi:molecular chaperone DnaJ